MALQILKNPALLPNMDDAYYHHATVEVKRNTGLQRLLGLGRSSVSVPDSCDPAYPVIRVIPPVWKQGEKDEWDQLQQCYEQVLQLAVTFHCDAVTIPLLAESDPDFPAYIDYKIAVDTIRSFLETSCIDVFLLASRQSAFQMPELRKDVEGFLSRNFFGDLPRWSNIPFTQGDDRFATLVPEHIEPSFDMSCDFDKYCGSDDSYRYDASYRFNAPPGVSEYSHCKNHDTPCPPSTGSSRNTGALPKIPNLDHPDAGFSEPLLNPIDKTDKKDSEIYNKANVSRQCSSKIRNNADYRPTKPTAVFRRNTGALPKIPNLDHLDAGFSETLLNLIDKTGKKDSEIYNKANVSRQHFSKIRNNPDYKPTKPTAIAFAIALELNMDETRDLIGRAGYALTNSSKFDVIIMYFIQNRNYNMFDINETLYEFDQSLLGA